MQGYSVSGFGSLSSFSDWPIKNPLWRKAKPVVAQIPYTPFFERLIYEVTTHSSVPKGEAVNAVVSGVPLRYNVMPGRYPVYILEHWGMWSLTMKADSTPSQWTWDVRGDTIGLEEDLAVLKAFTDSRSYPPTIK